MPVLNKLLFPSDAPVVKNQESVFPLRFDWENEAGVISTSKIRQASIGSAQIGQAVIDQANINNFNFSQGTGGTLTLGGTSNGNGVMQVLNAAGGTVVTASNTGIAVTNGSITINNSSGSTTFDGTGVLSESNFILTSASTGGGGTQVIGTTETAFTNGTLTFTLSRTSLMQFYAIFKIYVQESFSNNTQGQLNIYMRVNGTAINDCVVQYYHGTADNVTVGPYYVDTRPMYNIRSLSSGTHNLVISGQCARTTGTANLGIWGWDMGYSKLGT